jgi:hypothetical protein
MAIAPLIANLGPQFQLRWQQFHLLQQGDRLLSGRRLRKAPMQSNGFNDLKPTGIDRIQGAHGFLKNHANPSPSVTPQGFR